MTPTSSTKERQKTMPASASGVPAGVAHGGRQPLLPALMRFWSGLERESRIGLKFCLALLITGCWPGADYLNQITISLHLITYGYFCFVAWKVNRLLKDADDCYPIGPREGVFFMIVPFFYIFWNFHWVSTAAEVTVPEHGRMKTLALGVLAAGASIMCFPDMIGRFPALLSVSAFAALFLIINGFLKKARRVPA